MKKHLLIRALRRAKLLPYLNLRVPLRVSDLGDNTVIVPLLGEVGLSTLFPTEPWMVKVIQALLGFRSGLFIDVGVNLGQTLIKVKSLKREVDYIGFEPNPACVTYVKELVRINEYSKCTIIPVGLSDEVNLLTLLANSEADSAASLVEGFRSQAHYTTQQHVVVYRLDDLIGKLHVDQVSTIKIDVEGAELQVIKGAKSTLATLRPFILAEILPIYDETTKIGRFRKSRQTELQIILFELGYGISRIDHTSGKINVLSSIETHADLDLSDYLFVPQEYLQDILRILG